MNNIIDRLKEISGVGDVLAERLAEEGFETYKSIARADEKELLKIDGIKESNVKIIQEDARRLREADKVAQENMLNALLQDADKLNDNIHVLVKHIRKKTPEIPPEETAKALRKEISRIMGGLDRVEDNLFNQMKRLTKGLAKADSKLAKIEEGKTKQAAEGLKKAQKKIDKALD